MEKEPPKKPNPYQEEIPQLKFYIKELESSLEKKRKENQEIRAIISKFLLPEIKDAEKRLADRENYSQKFLSGGVSTERD